MVSLCQLLRSPLAIATMSAVPPCSQGRGHAGKPYTIHREVHGMSLCTCVMLGGTDSASYQTAFLPFPSYHRRAAAPKTKIIFHRDEVTTAKACAVGVRESKTLLWVCEIGATLSLQVVSQICAQLMAFLRPKIKHTSVLFFIIKKKKKV